MVKNKIIIPKNTIIQFDCVDKTNNEIWTDCRSPINIPRPFRMVILGPPNSHKSGLAKNVLIHAKPEYSEVFVWSNGASKEWASIADQMITTDDIEEDKELDIFKDDILVEELENKIEGRKSKKQRLLIIDDIEISKIQNKMKKQINLLFKHISSHYNLSIIVCLQDYSMLPVDIRSCLNVFAISLNFKDLQGISIFGRKVGLSYANFKKLFSYLKDKIPNRQFSYLILDNTANSPNPISINFFDKIENIEDIINDKIEEKKIKII